MISNRFVFPFRTPDIGNRFVGLAKISTDRISQACALHFYMLISSYYNRRSVEETEAGIKYVWIDEK